MLSHAPVHHLNRNQRIVRQSIWYGLVATFVLIAIIAVHYQVYFSSESLRRSDHEKLNLETGKTAITTELSNIQSDVNFLARQAELHRYFDNFDANTRSILGQDFVLFSNEKRIYDQIRIIDIDGQETIRINNQSGQAIIVDEAQLQNKIERYYFRETLKLEQSEIYISPFDLNIEHEEIEIPIKPMIRFGKPLFDSSGNRVGVLILNYLGDRLLNSFRSTTSNIARHAMLLNYNGYWLSHHNRDLEWGFMLDHERSFSGSFKQEWETISASQSGQFETANGIFSFTTIYPGREITGIRNILDSARLNPEYFYHHWKLVSHISVQELDDLATSFLQESLFLYLSIFIVFIVGTHIIARLQASHQIAENEVEFERHFRTVLESIEIKVLAVDLEGNITFCNDALLNLLNRERDKLIGNSWVDEIVASHNRNRCTDFFQKLVAGAQDPGTHESWLVDRSDNEYLVKWHESFLTDTSDNPVGLIFMGEDITHVRENEIRVRHLSEAVEQSPASVVLTNVAGLIEYVNPKFESVTGYSLEEVKGFTPRILKSGETSREDYSELWRVIKLGGVWRGIFHNRKKSGDLYWESASISGIRSPEGEITHFLAVKEDITEQKMLEERFQHCFNSAPVAMVMSDDQGRILLANEYLQNLYGYSLHELIGQDIGIVVPSEAGNIQPVYREESEEPEDNQEIASISGDIMARRKDGQEFPIEVGFSTAPSLQGKLNIAAIIDLTARIKLEKELLQRNEEIGRNRSLNKVGRMANMIAHDLRNPLSSIKMGLQITQKKSNDITRESTRELNQIALDQVQYMEEILSDLMSYSKPDALNLEWVDIGKTLNHCINLVQKEIISSNATINTWYEKGLPLISVDTRKFRQIISNLLDNAIQSVESLDAIDPVVNISVRMELSEEKPCVKIRIADNGCGIGDETVDELFEPFYTNRSKGTGLGLPIAKRYIELLHGTLNLKPGDSGGCVATVRLVIDSTQ
ncbi:MAG: PAS domain S-box protein [Gammaproteobacteria bacterium]|nr:PAS domain S-box protein [Gammaproteobacteria bacterium]